MKNNKRSPDFIKPKKKKKISASEYIIQYDSFFLFACVKLVFTRNLQALVPFLIYLVLFKCYVSSVRLISSTPKCLSESYTMFIIRVFFPFL